MKALYRLNLYRLTAVYLSVFVSAFLLVSCASDDPSVPRGSLEVTVHGVEGLAAGVTVTGPHGFNESVTSTKTLSQLAPGDYTVTAAGITDGGSTYLPHQERQDVTVIAGAAAAVTVTYALQPGQLALAVTGLPAENLAPLSVVGPAGYREEVTGGRTLARLTPGDYTVTAAQVTVAGGVYLPAPVTQRVTVTSGATASAGIDYDAQTGSLEVSVTDLPDGVTAGITVTGPGGYVEAITGTTTLADLAPGGYTITATDVTHGGNSYIANPISQPVTVASNATAHAEVAYFLQAGERGSLGLSITGLPDGAGASVTVTGPGGFSQSVTSSSTLANLTPGDYTVTAANVTFGGNAYLPTPTTQTRTVTVGGTVRAGVNYVPQPGRLAVELHGLPAGIRAAVTVTGPGGFSQEVAASTTLSNLVPGAYTITAAEVVSGISTYRPTPASETKTVTSVATETATVGYALQSGALTVNLSGLPPGTDASVTVTGPADFSRDLTASTTLNELAPGLYTLTAREVSNGASTYSPDRTSETVTLSSGRTEIVDVKYSLPRPEISAPAPNPLELSAEPGQPVTGSLSFENVGGIQLSYSASESAEWLTVTSGSAGTLLPGETATVQVQATCPDSAATLSAPLAIRYHADEPTESVTVNLLCSHTLNPVVTITEPADGASFEDGRAITFTATATSGAGDDLSSLISWRSEGEDLHTGASFTATLPLGTHTITASVTDAEGRTGQMSVTLEVANCADPVTIPDAGLRSAVREALSKPSGSITCADMEELTYLTSGDDFGDLALQQLAGLQHARKVAYLSREESGDTSFPLDASNPIGSLEGLQYAKNLVYLNLAFNEISDLSPLANLTKLEELTLWDNTIRDLSPLAGLTSLVYLDLDDNHISDISPLVRNNGLADNDLLYMMGNCLDATAGSRTMADIGTLEDRGVDVRYLGQRDLSLPPCSD